MTEWLWHSLGLNEGTLHVLSLVSEKKNYAVQIAEAGLNHIRMVP